MILLKREQLDSIQYELLAAQQQRFTQLQLPLPPFIQDEFLQQLELILSFQQGPQFKQELLIIFLIPLEWKPFRLQFSHYEHFKFPQLI